MIDRKEYRKKYEKEYWQKPENKERKKLISKKYNDANKDKVKLSQKKYCDNNPDKRKESCKNWQLRNKEKLKAYGKEYYKKNAEKERLRKKEYRKTDTWKAIMANVLHKRRTAMKQTDITTKFMKKLLADTTICEICNKKIKRKSLDHIIPINVGGLHIQSNVRVVCLRCNCKRPKDGSDIIQFRLL